MYFDMKTILVKILFSSIGPLGLILTGVLCSYFQLSLVRVNNGNINDLFLITFEQIPTTSMLHCSTTCAERNHQCLSIIFDSENGQCYLLPRGIYQNVSKPEFPSYLKVYTRRNVQCSDTGYQDLNVSGTCFKVYSEGKSHADAMTQCHKDGGYLIQVTSAMKHEVVSQFIKSMTSDGFFIDGSDADEEDVWRLSNGNPFHLKWSPDEPNICCKVFEDCLIMYTVGTYNDVQCYSRFSFICEREALPIV
ncbi:aggrecan core protein-like [Ostrea edulis]|uniref:aggrecan core protein-like n=1 Tax=Ostrea edulis TaxID=37623 RepID=UPI0024AE9514|nr:aggrecan core protein-like [Ostrea edulis]